MGKFYKAGSGSGLFGGSNTDPVNFIPPDLELCSFYSGRVPSLSSRQACNPMAVVYVQNVLTHLILYLTNKRGQDILAHKL